VTVLPGVKEIKDALGIWTGKRQFRVKLKDDSKGLDGFVHPPAAFTIGGNRGFLMYAGQPRFCRKCNTYGHVAETCMQTHCRNCGGLGHTGKECQEAKRCDLCNAADHLARNCPKPKPYAAALKANMAPPREHVEDTTHSNGEESIITDLKDVELVVDDILDQQNDNGEKQTQKSVEDKHMDESEAVAPPTTTPATDEERHDGNGENNETSVQPEPWNRVRRDKKRKVISHIASPQASTSAGHLPTGNRYNLLGEDDELADDAPNVSGASSIIPPSGVPAGPHSQEPPEGENDKDERPFHKLFRLSPFISPPVPETEKRDMDDSEV